MYHKANIGNLIEFIDRYIYVEYFLIPNSDIHSFNFSI